LQHSDGSGNFLGGCQGCEEVSQKCLKNRLEENQARGNVEGSEGPVAHSVGDGKEEAVPRNGRGHRSGKGHP